MATKKITKIKKDVSIKKSIVKKIIKQKAKVTLTSYTIKATISTGDYSNIQPEITVIAPSLEEAEAVVMPHIMALYEKHLNFTRGGVRVVAPSARGAELAGNGSKPKTAEETKPVAPKNPDRPTASKVVAETPKGISKDEDEEFPTSNQGSESEAYVKARTAIQSCTSQDALKLVYTKIENSKKLSEQEKESLGLHLLKQQEKIESNK
ncbi:MAG: hypothetical protein V4509_00650 [Patescibacteria group bacterium]